MKQTLLSRITPFFDSQKIDAYAVLPAEECPPDPVRLKRMRVDFPVRSYLILLFPYFVSCGDNLSAYATSEDYHGFAQAFGDELIQRLGAEEPGASFRFFCDKSPVDERRAAVRAGLGVFGDNGLLISHAYGSYVFIAEVISSLGAQEWGTYDVSPLKGCVHCGTCKQNCPTACLSDVCRPCVSALTQKKGMLTEEEKKILLDAQTVWGCDECQRSCPLNHPGKERKTPIPFFYHNRIRHLDKKTILEMDDDVFERRAFSWRGRDILLRNLALFEEKEKNPR